MAGKAARILVVDDHRPTRQSLCLLLREVGYEATGVGSAAEARLYLKEGAGRADVIVLDLWMPQEDGESLLAWVRGEARFARTAVVIYSAAPEHEHEARVRAAGADDFLPKPTPVAGLLARIGKWAQREGMERVDGAATVGGGAGGAQDVGAGASADSLV